MPVDIITTTVGAVEVEIIGKGTPILVIHGSPGGVDGARYMSRFLQQDKFKTICVSRPGYCGTPLHPVDPSIDREADLLAAVLDKINIECVGVLAWSGGGPAAYRFAVRHPRRVSSVVAIAALSKRWVAPRATPFQWLTTGTAFGQRLVALGSKKVPAHIVQEALKSEGTVRGEALSILTQQVMANPEQRQLILEIVLTVNTSGRRRAGWRNDVANFARIDSLELGLVQCPVLLIHGEVDTDAIIEYSSFAHAELPNSTFVKMEQGTHLSFYAHPEAPKVQEQAREWLQRNSKSHQGGDTVVAGATTQSLRVEKIIN